MSGKPLFADSRKALISKKTFPDSASKNESVKDSPHSALSHR